MSLGKSELLSIYGMQSVHHIPSFALGVQRSFEPAQIAGLELVVDADDGDLSIISALKKPPRLELLALVGDRDLPGKSSERSSFEGFFLFCAASDRVPSMSRSELAFRGRPLAITELDVCWDITNGTLALS